jgi:hypothetical protein
MVNEDCTDEVTLTLTDLDWIIAKERAVKIYNEARRLGLKENFECDSGRILGELAQYRIYMWMLGKVGLDVECREGTAFGKADEYDILFKGKSYDVKCGEAKNDDGEPYSKVQVNDKQAKSCKCDYYIFAYVNWECTKLYIQGFIEEKKFVGLQPQQCNYTPVVRKRFTTLKPTMDLFGE